MVAKQKQDMKYWINTAIGLLLMFGIPLLPPVDPITKIGMQIGGIFIGAVYLWSTVGTFWPCLLTIIALGFTDYANIYTVLAAFADYTPMLMLFTMILGGAISECGLTQYIGRWFLTRKIINGRPSVFNFMMMVAMFIVSAFLDPLLSLLVLWPSLYIILEEVGYTPKDAYYKILIVSTFLAVTLGQSTLPFFGAQLIILGALESASGLTANYAAYIFFNIMTSLLIFLTVTLLIKFVLRPDMSKMAGASIAKINDNPLPPMNKKQKIYTATMMILLAFAIVPSILPADLFIIQFINRLTLVGFTILAIAVLAILRVDGEPVLDASRVTRESVSWDLYLLVVVAIFFSGCLMADETGIKPWLIGILTPIFGSHGQMFFIVCITVIGVLVTNVANNAITGAILMQIIVAMAPTMGITNPLPLAMMITMTMFLAVLTPAASPYAAVLHTNKERVSAGDILKYGSVLLIVSICIYIIIGLPLANLLF